MRPSHSEMMVPTVQLAGMMELPSEGSKAMVYCSEGGGDGAGGSRCRTGRSTGSSSLLAVWMEG